MTYLLNLADNMNIVIVTIGIVLGIYQFADSAFSIISTLKEGSGGKNTKKLLVSVISLVVLLSIVGIYAYGKVAYIKVPDFTNMTADRARSEANKVGLLCDINDDAVKKQLTIIYQEPDIGTYIKKDRKVFLDIGSKPTVNALDFASITTNSIRLSATLVNNGGKDIIQYGFLCDGKKYPVENIADTDMPLPFNTQITGLDEGTQYSISAYAINENGEFNITPHIIVETERSPKKIANFINEVGNDTESYISYDVSLTNEDLASLSMAQNLREIEITDKRISNLNSIDRLTNLKKLNVSSNDIKDVSVFVNLKNLVKLDICDNPKIDDINALRNLQELTWLCLDISSVTDLSAVNSCHMLEFLRLFPLTEENCASLDFTNLKHLEDVWLFVGHEATIDASKFEGLDRLRNIILSRARVVNCEYLQNSNSLETLDLSNCDVDSLEFLKNLQNLKTLELVYTKLNGEYLTMGYITELQEELPNVKILWKNRK